MDARTSRSARPSRQRRLPQRRARGRPVLDRLRLHFRRGCDEGSASMASYVVAAAFFILGTSYLIQFVVEPPGSGTSSLEHIALRSQGQHALEVLLGTPGMPRTWGATPSDIDSASEAGRLGLLETGSSIRVNTSKFDALARGKLTTTSNVNGAIDYAEAKSMLGLDGYEFHLRAYPVVPLATGSDYGVEDMEDFDVAYVGRISTAGVWSAAAQYEADALDNLAVAFTNATRSTDPLGDVFVDESSRLRQHLLPSLGATIQQEEISAGAGTKHDFRRLPAAVYDQFLTANVTPSDLSSAMTLSTDANVMGYTKNRELRAILGTANLTGTSGSGTLATIHWHEWVDTDKGNGTTDCGDYGYVEVSGDGGATWVKLTDSATERSQDCAPLALHGPVLTHQSADITGALCAACANKADVLVAFHWIADNDNTAGYGWVVDNVQVKNATDGKIVSRKTFESPEYDLLVIGSDVQHNAFTPEEVKAAIRDFVDVYGGRLVVLGGQSNVQWLDRLFDAAVGGASGGIAAPDNTHPILTVPNALSYTQYDAHTPWDFTGSADAGLFSTVTGTSDEIAYLTISRQGAWGEGDAAEGAVVLSSYKPGTWGKDETRKFFANTLVYGKYHYLYLEVGPPVPTSEAVASATRSATMNMHREGYEEEYIEMAFIMYVWPGASAADTLSATTVNAMSPRDLTVEATDRMTWVNWTWPVANGTGTAERYEIWRGNGPTSITTLAGTLDVPPPPSHPARLSYHDTGLTNGTAYWYHVKLVTTKDGASASGTASAAAGAVPIGYPTAPTALDAEELPTSIRLTWNAPGWTGPGPLYGYAVWGKRVGDPSYTLVAEIGNVTEYTHSPPDTEEWMYTVAAINARGYGPNSTASPIAQVLSPAGAPTLSASNATAGRIVLSWVAPQLGGSSIESYHIDRSADGSDWYRLAESMSDVNLSWIDLNVTANTTYHYRVAGVTAEGAGTWSDPVEKPTMGVPWQVKNVVKTSSIHGVSMSFSWDPANTAGGAITNYEIWRAAPSDPASMSYLGVTTSTSYTDVLPDMTKAWYYQVRANNSAGSGPWSDAAQMPMTAGAPTVTVTNLTAGKLTLTWTLPDVGSGVPQSYKVHRSSDGTTYAQLAEDAGLLVNRTFIDATVAANATYHYRVQLVTDAGDGTLSTPVSKQVMSAPWTVAGLARTGGITGVSVTMGWTAANGAGSPVLNYSVCWGESAYVEEGCDHAVLTTSKTHLTSSLYHYWVRATNAIGTGPNSTAAQAKGTPDAPAPTLDNSTVGRIALSWSAPAMNGGTFSNYTIYRSDDGSAWYELANASSTNRSWSDRNVSMNATYYYRVAETNEVGQGPNSTDALKRTIGPAWKVPITLDNSTANALEVSWSAPNLGGGTLSTYRIERSANGSDWTLLANTSIANSNRTWKDTGLASNTTYQYRVVAVTDAGVGDVASGTAERTRGAPWAVTGLARASGVAGISVTMSWDAANTAGSAISNYTLCWGASAYAETGCDHNVLTTSKVHLTSSTYYYWARATNAIGTGPNSSAVLAKNAPSAPSPTLTNATAGAIGLSWSAPNMGGGTFSGYTIYRSVDGDVWQQLANSTSTNRSWIDANVTSNTTYWYRVAETNEMGHGANSTDASKTTMGPAWPPTVTSISNTTAGRLAIAWNAPNLGGGTLLTYRIERSTNGTTWTLLANTSAANANRTWSDATVAANTTYHYRVTAVTGHGEGGTSASVSKKTLGAPWTVNGLVRTGGNALLKTISMTWNVPNDGGSGILTYEIHRGTSVETMSFVGTSVSNAYTDVAPAAGTYYYKVRAANAVGSGEWSTPVAMATS